MNVADPKLGAPGSSDALIERMHQVVRAQQKAQITKGTPDADTRIDRLNRAIGLLVDHGDALAEALVSDFGHRSHDQSLLADIAASIASLKYARAHVRRWMKAERRKTEFPLGLLGAKAEITYQPKGVVGIVVPWNFPVQLTMSPLAGVLAAGNRVVIKPSEFTPATSDLLARLFAKTFDELEIAVFPGDAAVGQAFSSLPLDHLLFTGSTSVGRHVMRAAAENLVPVTLELGGKSPVIVGASAKLPRTATSIAMGKMMNAGQICIAPDYLLVPKAQARTLVSELEGAVAKMYPTLKDNPDYTSVINQRHYDRLKGYVEEAREAGAEVIEINPAREDFSQQPHHKMPLQVILDPADDLKVMQDEIFGPVLPVKTYSSVDEAIAYVNDRPRPLALYYFGEDAGERGRVLSETVSGGACVNETLFHVSMDDLPFGGVGPSGMGAYHGPEGFKTFSHAKGVFTQSKIDVAALLRPPFGDRFRKQLRGRISR